MDARRLPLWSGIAGTLLFTLIWLVEGGIRPGYDPMRSWISELALSGRGWIQIAGFLIGGALITVFGRGLRAAFTDGPAAIWGPRAVTAAGLALFAAGLFVIDPGTYRPPGTVAGTTWHGVLHDIAGPVMFLSVAAAAVIYSRRFARLYGLVTGGLMIALWLAAGVLNGLDHAGVWSPAPAGLFQRLSVLTGFAYLAYLACRALAASAPAASAAYPATGDEETTGGAVTR
ncbi:DUF998 domain-containing protein [Streptosporangium sp. NPDC023963]|uniref:DUF998 domain-containing protein n=1 Tax=Streptosporangium sp. NPDC023963 TaxID=3155608 RepID=UPI00341725A1